MAKSCDSWSKTLGFFLFYMNELSSDTIVGSDASSVAHVADAASIGPNCDGNRSVTRGLEYLLNAA